MTNSTRVLTVADALAVAAVLSAAQRLAPVARLTPDGDVLRGVTRGVGDDQGMLAWSWDVRDCYLRVTLYSGPEVFWPMTELVSEYWDGTFVLDPSEVAAR